MDAPKEGIYDPAAQLARRARSDAPERADRLLSPGPRLGTELRRRGRGTRGTFPPVAHRHGHGIAAPSGRDADGRPHPGPHSPADRGRAGSTKRRILDRAAHRPCGVDHRPDSGPPGRSEDSGIPRRRVLDAGAGEVAHRPPGHLRGRHRERVNQDAYRQGPLFRRDSPSERHTSIVCLVNTCDVFRYIFDIDEETEERIAAICQMDLDRPFHRRSRSPTTRPVRCSGDPPCPSRFRPSPLPRLLLNPHLRTGNVPALFADLANEYGPVFQVRPPFRKPMIFLAGPPGQSLDAQARAHAPESLGLFCALRDHLRCVGGVVVP